jgi:protein-S-isoprenylcysteine O-methyltransferase Ste14
MVLNYLIALKADQELTEKFGEDYERYMKKVPRMNFLAGFMRLVRRRKGK